MGNRPSSAVPSAVGLPRRPSEQPVRTNILDSFDHKVLQSMLAEALPGLWIGNRNAASHLGVLKRLNIGACVNCTDDAHMHPSHFRNENSSFARIATKMHLLFLKLTLTTK